MHLKSLCVNVNMFMCVYTPKAINNYSHETKPSYIAFQFLYTVPTVDLFQGHGLSNEGHLELLSKKAKVRLYYSLVKQKNAVLFVVHH